jgi:hypothetical protein
MEHVDVDGRDKHDVENPDIAEDPETVIALEDIESVRAGRYSGKDQSGYRRYPESPEQHGTEQDYHKNREKYGYRMGEREHDGLVLFAVDNIDGVSCRT